MQEKLSQYDLLARLVPGGALLWVVNWIMVTSQSGSVPLVQGGITEAIAYALVAYVAGLFLDSIGRWVVEPLVFKWFGKPSRTFLRDRNGISETERVHFRQLAVSKLKLPEEMVSSAATSQEVSEFICRRVMAAFGHSNDKARSTYVQYTLHRSLSAALIMLLAWSVFLCAKGKLDWTAVGFELFVLVIFLFGVNHWSFRIVRTAFELMDADSLGVKIAPDVKTE